MRAFYPVYPRVGRQNPAVRLANRRVQGTYLAVRHPDPRVQPPNLPV